MVHNGIEYGLMQAYAEGFDIFKNATSKDLPEDIRYDLNLPDIAEVWRRGSVVSSWLLDLTAMALVENPTLSEYSGFVQDSGEGRWTIQAALEEAVPAEVLTAASLHALPLAAGSYLRREDAFRHAPEIRRPHRTQTAGEDVSNRCVLQSCAPTHNEETMALTDARPAPTKPQQGRTADPCVMVIFGFTGDLTRRKLIPALYNLASQQLLSREFAVIGVGRSAMSDDDARKKVIEDFKQFATGAGRRRFVGMVCPPHQLHQRRFRRSRHLRQAERSVGQGRSGARLARQLFLLPCRRAQVFRRHRASGWRKSA